MNQPTDPRTWVEKMLGLRPPPGKVTKGVRRLREREMWVRDWVASKRDLSGRANGTIDPYYGCFLLSELQDYALNYSLPWSAYISTFQNPFDIDNIA